MWKRGKQDRKEKRKRIYKRREEEHIREVDGRGREGGIGKRGKEEREENGGRTWKGGKKRMKRGRTVESGDTGKVR